MIDRIILGTILELQKRKAKKGAKKENIPRKKDLFQNKEARSSGEQLVEKTNPDKSKIKEKSPTEKRESVCSSFAEILRGAQISFTGEELSRINREAGELSDIYVRNESYILKTMEQIGPSPLPPGLLRMLVTREVRKVGDIDSFNKFQQLVGNLKRNLSEKS